MNRVCVVGVVLASIAGSAVAQVESPDFRFRARLRAADNGQWGSNSTPGSADFRVHSRFMQVYYGGVRRLDEFRVTIAFDFTNQSELDPAYESSIYNTDYDVYFADRYAGRVDMNAYVLGQGELQYDSRHADFPTLPLPADFPEPILATDSVTVYAAATIEPAMGAHAPAGATPLFTGNFNEEFERGDVNQDRNVDMEDWIFLAGNFDPCGGLNPHFGPAQGDFTGDGGCTIDDYALMATNWTDRDDIPGVPSPVTSAPTITSQPVSAVSCPARTTVFRVTASALGTVNFRWQRETFTGEWQDLADGINTPYGIVTGSGSPFLSIRRYTAAADGNYRCQVWTGCGAETSQTVSLLVCPADHNCDGAVDGDDLIAFFGQWDSGLAGADINHDNGVDGDDVITFFERWDSGC